VKANVIHGDFNPCGGAERLSLVTMKALSEKGIEYDLTTLKSPDITKLENSFGKNLVSVIRRASKINIINILEELRQQQQKGVKDHYNYDVTINTNGDAAPYYHPSFSKINAITYCHFPSTKYHIESENTEYLRTDLGMEGATDIHSKTESYGSVTNRKFYDSKLQFRRNREYFTILEYGYWNLMKNSILVTNSEFSRRAIVKAIGLNDVHVLSPPIDIETFSGLRLKRISNESNNIRNAKILVIARIAPHKKIENAIKLAKILNDNNIGKGMKIVGNLYHYFMDYYSEIKQMVLELGLTDYVRFEINASLNKLLSVIQESSVYFHPMVGEHFGMSVIEAMASGLITVVPKQGGVAEFVPQRYQFNTIEDAAKIIMHVCNHVYNAEEIEMSKDINKFSNSHYIKGFQKILNDSIIMKKK
jgi:glycosyltransferase involved in cell wall biosynthesis